MSGQRTDCIRWMLRSEEFLVLVRAGMNRRSRTMRDFVAWSGSCLRRYRRDTNCGALGCDEQPG